MPGRDFTDIVITAPVSGAASGIVTMHFCAVVFNLTVQVAASLPNEMYGYVQRHPPTRRYAAYYTCSTLCSDSYARRARSDIPEIADLLRCPNRSKPWPDCGSPGDTITLGGSPRETTILSGSPGDTITLGGSPREIHVW